MGLEIRDGLSIGDVDTLGAVVQWWRMVRLHLQERGGGDGGRWRVEVGRHIRYSSIRWARKEVGGSVEKAEMRRATWSCSMWTAGRVACGSHAAYSPTSPLRRPVACQDWRCDVHGKRGLYRCTLCGEARGTSE
jgi:hypothetical protein